MLDLRVLVVDDEELARSRIARFLGSACVEAGRGFQVEHAENALQALERVGQFRPEIIFLDIEMPGMNGIELLAQIDESRRDFKIIFQTAYDEFALQAFDQNAIDYLLKPFDEMRFGKALAKALAAIDASQLAALAPLEHTYRRRDGHMTRLCVRQGNRLRLIELGTVSAFVSRDHCTCIHADGIAVELISDLSLSHLEERLDPQKFWRIHRNAIVAVERIESLKGGEKMSLTLDNKMEIAVSRANRARIAEYVKGRP